MQRDLLSRPAFVGAFPGRPPVVFHGARARRRFAVVYGPFSSADDAHAWIAAQRGQGAAADSRAIPGQLDLLS